MTTYPGDVAEGNTDVLVTTSTAEDKRRSVTGALRLTHLIG